MLFKHVNDDGNDVVLPSIMISEITDGQSIEFAGLVVELFDHHQEGKQQFENFTNPCTGVHVNVHSWTTNHCISVQKNHVNLHIVGHRRNDGWLGMYIGWKIEINDKFALSVEYDPSKRPDDIIVRTFSDMLNFHKYDLVVVE